MPSGLCSHLDENKYIALSVLGTSYWSVVYTFYLKPNIQKVYKRNKNVTTNFLAYVFTKRSSN